MILTPLDSWIAEKIGRPGQPLTRADLENYQLQQLSATIALVREKSTFYRRHLSKAPECLACLQEIGDFPFTTAADLRASPLDFLCGSQDIIHRVVTLNTSGTTGLPKRIYFTQADQELTIDFFRVGMSTFTVQGDRVLILLPGETPGSVGDLLAAALRRLRAVGVKHGPQHDASQTLEVIVSEAITTIVGTPVQVLALARHPAFRQKRWLGVRNILLTADHVPNAVKHAVEHAWGCEVFNHYGMTESGLGGGVECRSRRGYHLREADLYYEVIDPQSGQPVPDGEAGEIVFSTLTRSGMPLIRYCTGDLGHFIPAPCSCGTTLKTLARVTTRLDGQLPLGDGILTMADLDEAIFPVEGVLNFTAVLEPDGELTRLKLDVMLMESQPESCIQAYCARIQQAVEDIPAVQDQVSRQRLSLRVEPIHVIPPQMAKRAIEDLRNPQASGHNPK